MIDRKLLPVLISLGFGAPLSGFAAEPSHRCSAIDDASQRLACYDAAFGRPAGATTVAITADLPAHDRRYIQRKQS